MTHTANYDLTALWTIFLSFWQRSILDLTVGHFIVSIVILAIAVLIRRFFSRTVISRIHAWSSGGEGDLNRTIVDALAPHLQSIPIVLAILIIGEFILTNQRLKDGLLQVDQSLIAFTIFWALFEVIGPLCAVLDGRTPIFSKAMIGWTVRVGRAIIVALGATAILEVWGIHVGPVLASFGLVGVAVALGAQNLFKNLISGIFIIGEQRFRNGDWILAEGIVEGTVETIGLRTTKVRRFDQAPVFVPNSYLADNAVTNFSQMTFRRISWIIGLDYSTTTSQLRDIRNAIEAYILGSSDFVHPPEAVAFVRVDKFNDSSIDLMVYCFTRTTVWGDWLKIKEELAYAIKAIVKKAGSDFAFPSQSLYVETLPTGIELFPHDKSSTPDKTAAPADAGADREPGLSQVAPGPVDAG
ncbi:mechanosensitive ion channel family protein [Bradyrhizobium acaciae]|uniref:mechanosensitive ion channel family protein n=1 Tax=Bradyrhizobium acaciae TaxID=2683706 RepID=UPI001E620C71|nr:mechanosensitive ion channel family protein [Bradyrhizobium acaciae]MCC8979062.1 mechanosensitive ion channel family protein [Bradyrhizobium acaciae]